MVLVVERLEKKTSQQQSKCVSRCLRPTNLLLNKTTQLAPFGECERYLRDRKTNFRFIIYCHSSTDHENLATLPAR